MSLLPDWLTGFDSANADAAAAADAQLQALNAVTYGPAYTPQDTQTYGAGNQQQQIDQAFTDALGTQADNIFGRTFRSVGEVVKAVLTAVPWWVWLLAGAGAFLYFGGGAIVRKKIVEKFA